MNQKIAVYTDGGCSGNPGPGGWAYVIITRDGTVIKNSGAESHTTNNKMELTAVIQALKSISPGSGNKLAFVVHTDSQYVRNGITSWIHNWERNGWKTANKKPVKNKELWMELKAVADTMNIEWVWVPGHAGVDYNEMCDSLVQQEMRKLISG